MMLPSWKSNQSYFVYNLEDLTQIQLGKDNFYQRDSISRHKA